MSNFNYEYKLKKYNILIHVIKIIDLYLIILLKYKKIINERNL